MLNRRETTITNELVNILRNMRHGWELETEVNAFIKGNSELDAIVVERGREPIGIEAKFATTTNAKNLIKQAETRLLPELEAEFYAFGKTLNNVMAILYPDRFKTMPGRDINSQLRAADDLQYKLVSTLGDTVGHFPKNGWATGAVGDIATALHVGAIPNSQLEQAAEEMELSVNRAANLLKDAIIEHQAIGTKIEAILHQEVFSKDKDDEEKLNTQTLRMAALIITDAFVFQSSLAGKAGMKSVRSLEQLLRSVNYADVVTDWNTILKVNYRPIFEDACDLVDALATDDRLVKPILTFLCEAALDLVNTGITQIHELSGIVFQKLITDRKYIRANYTLPESAVLLSTLVMPKLTKGKLPKVADFACGTGALLNGVYQRILFLYEQAGGNSRDIHQQMLEKNIGGVDIMPNATHLTAASLASTHPDKKIRGTRILTAPHGRQDDGSYAVGSLELLDEGTLFDTDAEQLGGEEKTVVKLQRAFEHGEFDIVIQNPPFVKHSADANTGIPKVVFQGSDRPEEETKALQAALKAKDTRVSHGIAGHGSRFVDLADKKLKSGGIMGVILPATILTSASMKKVRDMWATEYHNVLVITIARADVDECAFSADTKMAECIVVATKGLGDDTGHAKFVSLTQRPKSALESMETANKILQSGIEDAIEVGEDQIGKVVECPIIVGYAWGATRIRSLELLRTAHQLANSVLSLPKHNTPISIPIARVEDIAQVGYTEPTIKGKNGAFTMVKGYEENEDGYSALWRANCQHQRSILAMPDSRAKMRLNAEAKAQDILERNSRVHYYLSPTFSATSAIASFTEEPSIGACILTNVKFNNLRHEITWTLWCNSTLGLLCHWMQGSKQQQGRGRLTHTTLKTMLTLDVRQLSAEALANAESVFEQLKYQRMLPLNECDCDPVRCNLDTRLLKDVLGINDNEVLAAMQTLREMLCAEPSIHGGKKSKCNLDSELAKMKLKDIPFPNWYLD